MLANLPLEKGLAVQISLPGENCRGQGRASPAFIFPMTLTAQIAHYK